MLKFIKNDQKSYEVRAANGDEYDWTVAGNLVKDENGRWNFEHGGLSVEYEDSLEETEVELEEELEEAFENEVTTYMSHYFGTTYKYNK